MTKEQLELNDVMSNFKAKLPLEMQELFPRNIARDAFLLTKQAAK